MGTAVADRWTCPTCSETVAPRVPLDEVAEEIRLAQLAHAARHTGRQVPPEQLVRRMPPRPPVRPAPHRQLPQAATAPSALTPISSG
ncbi:hypothetical protein [Blastococcus sp. CCUG 61487]|uniref:hypothetical protein n=1 Tax=Blastococcus sp. CCUG 61487 TaxID=1840703 RepID=UPI00113CA27A|nr:hypothetical protein [Blastococcus sp. CCUG 61487]TKJ25239.1 hypothetical protein A6V29_04245 [Blastococcus sp. CCUG 61487]